MWGDYKDEFASFFQMEGAKWVLGSGELEQWEK